MRKETGSVEILSWVIDFSSGIEIGNWFCAAWAVAADKIMLFIISKTWKKQDLVWMESFLDTFKAWINRLQEIYPVKLKSIIYCCYYQRDKCFLAFYRSVYNSMWLWYTLSILEIYSFVICKLFRRIFRISAAQSTFCKVHFGMNPHV